MIYLGQRTTEFRIDSMIHPMFFSTLLFENWLQVKKLFHPKEAKLIYRQSRCWGLWRLRLNFENSTSKFFMELWKVGFYYQKSKANLWNSSKDLIYLTVLSILLHSSKMVFKEEWKRQINKTLETFVIQRLAADFSDLPKKFWGWNLKIQHHLTSITSKTVRHNILKIASNQCISSNKDWWQVWIIGRDRTKTKCPQQCSEGCLLFIAYES